VDDIIASLGSVNFDPRSFHLNFEVTAIFSNDATNQVVQAMEFDLTQSTKIDINEWNRRGLLTRLIQGFINLFSPLF
jgi:cardiolipin synthase